VKIEYDSEADALYIRIQDKEVFRTREIEEGFNIDLDDKGAGATLIAGTAVHSRPGGGAWCLWINHRLRA